MDFEKNVHKILKQFRITGTGRNRKSKLRLTLTDPRSEVGPFNYTPPSPMELFEGFDSFRESDLIGRTVGAELLVDRNGIYHVLNVKPIATYKRNNWDGRPSAMYRARC